MTRSVASSLRPAGSSPRPAAAATAPPRPTRRPDASRRAGPGRRRRRPAPRAARRLAGHDVARRGSSIVQLPSPGDGLRRPASSCVERGTARRLTSWISTQRVLVGFAIGASLGLAPRRPDRAVADLGHCSSARPSARSARCPSLAWVPLLILWLKIGEESKITLIAIGAFFPVYTTVAGALRHVDRQLVEAGRAFGLRGVRLFTTIQLPAVLPSVISGLRLGPRPVVAVPRRGRAHRLVGRPRLPAGRLAEQRPRGPHPAGHHPARRARQDDRRDPRYLRTMGGPPMDLNRRTAWAA